MPASDPIPPADEARKPIDARGVAWALTGVTVFVITVGVVLVRTAGPPPVPVSDEIRERAPTPPPPIVLQPRRVDGAQSEAATDTSASLADPTRTDPESAAGSRPARVAERPLPLDSADGVPR